MGLPAHATLWRVLVKLLVLGATGATGRLVVDQALTAGHFVRALVRSPQKLSAGGPGLEIVTGQATNPGDVTRAMAGIDAVISTLGATKGTVMTDASHAIIDAAHANGVRRIVLLSSFLVLRERLSTPAKVVSGMAMSAMIKDKVAGEALLRASDLNWTIAHALRLSDGPATAAARILPDTATLRLGESISRADVAAWLLAAAGNEHTAARRAVAIAA